LVWLYNYRVGIPIGTRRANANIGAKKTNQSDNE